jgi:MFS family permease
MHAPLSKDPRKASGIAVVFAVCLAALILPLSFSGGAVATPEIGRDLGGSATSLTWITNAFMLTFGSLLMTAGALADQFGRKRVFLTGVGIFTFFSGLLSFAPSVLVIDLLRAAQGVGAAAALAGGSAAMAQEFDGHARIRAFSMLGTTFGIGLAFGPMVAGFLSETLGWQSIFITSTVIGVIALGFGVRTLHETRDPHATGLDWPGVLSFTAALSLFTFGVIQAPEAGWTHPQVLLPLAGALLSIALFVWTENRVARPMLDLSLFRYPRFVGVQLLPIATCYSYVVLLILLPLRFIGVEDQTAIHAGILMLALSAPMLFVPTLAVTLSRHVSPGILTGIGLLVAAGGLLWLGRTTPADGLLITLPMLVIGAGAGMPWGLMDALSVTVVPKERAGMASGIFNTTKVAGEGVALAIVSAGLAGLSNLAIRNLGATGIPDAKLREIGARLVNGDIAHALPLAPGIDRSLLVQGYNEAFHTLTLALAAITMLSAIASFALLGRTHVAGADEAIGTESLAA